MVPRIHISNRLQVTLLLLDRGRALEHGSRLWARVTGRTPEPWSLGRRGLGDAKARTGSCVVAAESPAAHHPRHPQPLCRP